MKIIAHTMTGSILTIITILQIHELTSIVPVNPSLIPISLTDPLAIMDLIPELGMFVQCVQKDQDTGFQS
jgi:hypothetical protein